MKEDILRLLGVVIIGVGFWVSADAILSSGEPWDSPSYLAWYLASLATGATVGWVFPARSGWWGPVIVFGQTPVLLMQASLEPTIVIAFGWLALEAIPAFAVSAIAGKARNHWLRRRRGSKL